MGKSGIVVEGVRARYVAEVIRPQFARGYVAFRGALNAARQDRAGLLVALRDHVEGAMAASRVSRNLSDDWT